MAATSESQDYYHLVVDELKKRNDTFEINTAAYNNYIWETQVHDRTEIYAFLDKWLCNGIDLVMVQLSENASDLTMFKLIFHHASANQRGVWG